MAGPLNPYVPVKIYKYNPGLGEFVRESPFKRVAARKTFGRAVHTAVGRVPWWPARVVDLVWDAWDIWTWVSEGSGGDTPDPAEYPKPENWDLMGAWITSPPNSNPALWPQSPSDFPWEVVGSGGDMLYLIGGDFINDEYNVSQGPGYVYGETFSSYPDFPTAIITIEDAGLVTGFSYAYPLGNENADPVGWFRQTSYQYTGTGHAEYVGPMLPDSVPHALPRDRMVDPNLHRYFQTAVQDYGSGEYDDGSPIAEYERVVVVTDGAAGAPPVSIGTYSPAPPAPGERERKVITRLQRIGMMIAKGLDVLSEGAEVVSAVYDALPEDVRRRWGKDRPERAGDQMGQYGLDGADWKLEALYWNWHKLDVVQAVQNILANEVEDRLYGRAYAARDRISRPRNFRRNFPRGKFTQPKGR